MGVFFLRDEHFLDAHLLEHLASSGWVPCSHFRKLFWSASRHDVRPQSGTLFIFGSLFFPVLVDFGFGGHMFITRSYKWLSVF